MVFDVPDVHQVLGALDAAGVEAVAAGGWGVDALLGEQTRPHADLDLLARIEDDGRIRSVLGSLGFGDVGGVATNYVLRDVSGREVDVHLARFEPGGRVVYVGADVDEWIMPADAFTRGAIGGRAVACLSIGYLDPYGLATP